MFAKAITGSARFLRMPATARLLYYDLGMQADDDGIVEAFAVMRTTGASEDDLNVLVAKGFVKVLDDDLVTMIVDWKKNNYIQKDRYTPSIYKDLLQSNVVLLESECIHDVYKTDTSCIQNGNILETQYSIGKISLGKASLDKDTTLVSPSTGKNDSVPYEEIVKAYNTTCKNLPKCTTISENRKKAIRARISSGYSVEQFKELFKKAQDSKFLCGANSHNWRASFDWLIKDANMAKVLDGNYDDWKGDGTLDGRESGQTIVEGGGGHDFRPISGIIQV